MKERSTIGMNLMAAAMMGAAIPSSYNYSNTSSDVGHMWLPDAPYYPSSSKNPYEGSGTGGCGSKAKSRKRRVSASNKGNHNHKAYLKRAKKRAVRAKNAITGSRSFQSWYDKRISFMSPEVQKICVGTKEHPRPDVMTPEQSNMLKSYFGF